MRIRNVGIRNFRGLKSLDWSSDARFVVLIGPGDSGKSTLLEAIALALSPRWNPQITDGDFYGGDAGNPISIRVTLSEPAEELVRDDKLGHWTCGIAPDGELRGEALPGDELALTVRLTVDETLEPTWEVVRDADSATARITANQRAALGVFRLGESSLPHLRWGRDSALLRLGDTAEIEALLISAQRAARAAVFEGSFEGLASTAKAAALALEAIGGATLEKPRPGLDPSAGRRGSSLLLHDGEIPATNLGMGTQRLAGVAFQLQALDSQGVALVDEVEAGLEPHRLLHVIGRLKERAARGAGQVIVTTHSPVVVAGVDATDLHIMRRGEERTTLQQVPPALAGLDAGLPQATTRSGPAAMLARRIVVCEGKTEVGICRALLRAWDEEEPVPAAVKGTAYRDGGGTEAPERAECLAKLGYATALFIDSDLSAGDKAAHAKRVKRAEASGVSVLRWSAGMALEDQIAMSLPRDGVRELLKLAVELNETDDPEDSVRRAIQARLGDGTAPLSGLDPVAWVCPPDITRLDVRRAIGQAARKKGWFKNDPRGEQLGMLLAAWLPEVKETDRLAKTLRALRAFVYDHTDNEINARGESADA